MRYGLPPEQPLETTIRVRMVKPTKATLDGGRTARVYEAGQDYDLPEWLAEAFFKGGEGDPAEAHEGLDAAGEQTHPEAAEAATEGNGDTARRADEGDDHAQAARQERRPRRPRRVHGE